MTMTKESLRKALERIDEGIDYIDPEAEVVAEAARFVERLLPETCDACNLDQCEDCHGTGQLWDEGLVEVVAQTIYDADNDSVAIVLDGVTQAASPWNQQEPGFQEIYRKMARAVLAALTQEVGK